MLRLILIGLLLSTAFDPASDAAEPLSVTGGGTTLSSVTLEWPTADRSFPNGPGVDVVNTYCSGCHSPGMVLTQPTLTQAEWQAEVTKMRKVYKADISDAVVPTIIEYLATLPAQP